jgi:glucokinase
MQMEKLLCGVDLGGTKLSAGLVNTDGSIHDKTTVYDHIDKDEYRVVDQITLMVRGLLSANKISESDLTGIGIGFPGHVRYKDGITITTSNLQGFKDFPLRSALEKNFSIPVLLDNDANAQALCEHKFGAGRGFESLIFMTISTGIGAGIILDGKLYRGMTGTAGEFGHTIINPDIDLLCTCGNRGCLMACASGLALPQLFKQKTEEGLKTKLSLPAGFQYSQVDGRLIKEGLEIDDPLSNAIMNDCALSVSIGIYNIFQVFNPPIIILGGGLMSWGEEYMGLIRSKFYDLARDMIYDRIEIVESEAGADAGLIGAAALLLE